jgi:uncharacterized membrane protein YcaP (DUF421 family)
MASRPDGPAEGRWLTLDDLGEQARLNDIASVSDIRRAILETNGQFRFIKQPS